MKVIEEQIHFCKHCDRRTKHYRNKDKSSGFMIMIHIVLILITLGVWIPIIIIWKLLFAKIGGWFCGSCG